MRAWAFEVAHPTVAKRILLEGFEKEQQMAEQDRSCSAV